LKATCKSRVFVLLGKLPMVGKHCFEYIAILKDACYLPIPMWCTHRSLWT